MGQTVRQRVAELGETTTQHQDEVPPEIARNPLYGVALLKIAMELKKPNAAGLDEILSGVLAKMHLQEDTLRRYLETNGGLLKTIAQKRQY